MTIGTLPLFKVDGALVQRQPDFLAATNLCMDLSGLSDEVIAGELDIEPAQFSRIRSGQAHIPPKKLQKLMDTCGNEVPLIWLAMNRNYDLLPTMTAMEKQIADRDATIADLEKKLAWTMELHQRAGR